MSHAELFPAYHLLSILVEDTVSKAIGLPAFASSWEEKLQNENCYTRMRIVTPGWF